MAVFSRKSQSNDASCHTAAASACRRVVNSLKRFLPKKITRRSRQKNDLPQEPEKLAAQVGPICADMLNQLHYPGAPKLKAEAVEGLLAYMHKRAIEFDVPLNNALSAKGFRLGYAEGLVSFTTSFTFAFSRMLPPSEWLKRFSLASGVLLIHDSCLPCGWTSVP